jgi:hypothetical protein
MASRRSKRDQLVRLAGYGREAFDQRCMCGTAHHHGHKKTAAIAGRGFD